jgi:hypothetical protein
MQEEMLQATCPDVPNYAIPKIPSGCASALPLFIDKSTSPQNQQLSSLYSFRTWCILQVLIRNNTPSM